MKKPVKYVLTAAVSTAVVSGIITGSNFMEQSVYAEEYVNEAEYELVTASTEGNWQYELNSGSITITKYTGTESNVTIPSEIGGYKVKRIGKSAFEENTSLKSVVIPENIVGIGDCAFKNCSNLSNITINAIGLADCSSNSDHTSIDYAYSVFYGAGNNTNGITVTFGNSVKSIPAYLFATGREKSSDVYPYVTTVNIPDSVTSIGKCAFKNCYDLKTINWGNSVQTIYDYAFESCNMISVSLPDSVKTIEEGAFEECSQLKSVTIPKNVVKLGDITFKNCVNLTNVTINAIELADCNGGSGNTSDNYYSVFYGAGTNTDGIEVAFGNKVKRIPAYLFATGHDKTSDVYCYIKSVSIPDSVTFIGKSAFKNCYRLADIDGMNKVQTIDSNAFESTGIKEVKLPESLTKLESNAFRNCFDLNNVVINAVEMADLDNYDTVFYGAGKAADNMTVTFGPSVIYIPKYLLATSDNKAENVYCHVKNVFIYSGIKEIGSRAFKNCYDLSSVTYYGSSSEWSKIVIGEENTWLTEANRIYDIGTGEGGDHGEKLTWELDSSGTLTISGSGDMEDYNLNSSPWYNDESIKRIVIEQGVKSIGSCAFQSCSGLTGIKIPDSVTRIGENAFSGCSGMTSITIPDSVTSIGEYAFSGCSSNLVIYAASGSYVEKYANTHGIKFVGVGWSDDGFWYENGVRQGVKYNEDGSIDLSYRGKEIYDPVSDAWYWLDSVLGGQVAKAKDVYQESKAGIFGDCKVYKKDGSIDVEANTGKWVRYDKDGHMIKGWCQGKGEEAVQIGSLSEAQEGQPVYYFDPIYGSMAKGYATIDGKEYYFDPYTGILEREVTSGVTGDYTGWKDVDGTPYWYENGVRQGYSTDANYRGKEIYDAASNAWYWLDNVQNGAMAKSKDVYQESYAGAFADRPDGTGKWVRYDENGHMIKGWSEMNGNTYYFDYQTGAMAKGWANIDGVYYYFDEATGIRA